MQPLRLLLRRFQKSDVVRGGVARKILGIGGGKRLRVHREQLQRIGFVESRQQGGLEVIGPGAHRERDAPSNLSVSLRTASRGRVRATMWMRARFDSAI